MHRVYVGLGSNLAHPRRRLAHAVRALERLPATRLIGVSSNYASAPIGTSVPQPDYVNAVATLDTRLPPRALLARLHAIERRAGRTRVAGERNEPRRLDLDLLLYGRRRTASAGLTLPHPRMHERAFVLRPLADVAPHASVPGHGAVRALLRSVKHQRVARTRTHRVR